MIYVAEIMSNTPMSSLYFDKDTHIHVRVHDTYTVRDMVVDCQELRNFRSLVGYGCSALDMRKTKVIVVYNAYQAQIFNHIKGVKTREKIVVMKDTADYISMSSDATKFVDVTGRKNLLVSMTKGLYLGGRQGSVPQFVYEFIGEERAFNMYDFVGQLCRLTGINVPMAYESVYMYCNVSEVSMLTFSHTLHSQRYWAKMFMDVMR